MLKFKMRSGVKYFKNKGEIILSVGILENNIITIDKKKLLEEDEALFNTQLEALIAGESIAIEKSDLFYKKFVELLNMGFLTIDYGMQDKRILIVELDERKISDGVENPCIKKVHFNDLLTDEEANILLEKVQALKTSDIFGRVIDKVKNFDLLFIMGGLHNMNRLKILNEVTKKAEKKAVFYTYDTSSCFVVGTDASIGTGCFECFITNMLSKKKIDSTDYQSEFMEIHEASLEFLRSICISEIQNIAIHGMSALSGNAISYIPGLYQYTFDFNRRTNLCGSCMEDYYKYFDEQNIAAINIIREKVG